MEQISLSKLSRYAKLRHKKHREEEHKFIVEGEKSVREMAGHFAPIALIATSEWFAAHQNDDMIKLFRDVLRADASKIGKISALSTPPKVMAVFEMPIVDQPVINRDSLYLAIDGVQDPGNMGTIIRTADWFGIKEIFASPNSVDIYNAKTIQATMGSLTRVKVYYTDLPNLFTTHLDMPVFGTLLDGANIYDTRLTDNGFIVMGNEGNGLSESVRKCVTHRLLIPPYPADSTHAESLNVGVATALVIGEFRRREISK